MDTRTEVIKVKVTPAEKERARGRAAREGTDVSVLIRRLLFAEAEEEIVTDSLFGVSEADSPFAGVAD